MKISTMNIRYENNHDGKHSWSNRRHLLANFINQKNFDFIGTQEGRKNQLLDLESLIELKMIVEHRSWLEERM